VKKALKWIVGILVVSTIVLVALGGVIHSKAQSFVKQQGGTNTNTFEVNRPVACLAGIPIGVRFKKDGEIGVVAVCVGLFSESHFGEVIK